MGKENFVMHEGSGVSQSSHLYVHNVKSVVLEGRSWVWCHWFIVSIHVKMINDIKIFYWCRANNYISANMRNPNFSTSTLKVPKICKPWEIMNRDANSGVSFFTRNFIQGWENYTAFRMVGKRLWSFFYHIREISQTIRLAIYATQKSLPQKLEFWSVNQKLYSLAIICKQTTFPVELLPVGGHRHSVLQVEEPIKDVSSDLMSLGVVLLQNSPTLERKYLPSNCKVNPDIYL